MNFFRKMLYLLALLTFGAALICGAQTINGTIAGTIVDATGAAIPGATVVVTNIQTGLGRTVKTNGAGGYRIESVQPGIYKVVVTAPSFAPTTIDHTDVTASVITSINAT